MLPSLVIVLVDILRTADRRARRGEIWDWGILVIHTWNIFDTVVFKVIWGSLGAFILKWPVSRKLFS